MDVCQTVNGTTIPHQPKWPRGKNVLITVMWSVAQGHNASTLGHAYVKEFVSKACLYKAFRWTKDTSTIAIMCSVAWGHELLTLIYIDYTMSCS